MVQKITSILFFMTVSFWVSANGDRIILREYTSSDDMMIPVYEVYAYENGNTTKVELPSMMKGKDDKRIESLNAFGKLLDKYSEMGYKVVSSTSRSYISGGVAGTGAGISTANRTFIITDFILEKQ